MLRSSAVFMLMCLLTSIWALAIPPSEGRVAELGLAEQGEISARSASSIELSTSTAVPGHPLTIQFNATGIAEQATWSDPYSEFGSGDGVYPCGDLHSMSTESHVIPLEWLEDGEEDCVNGTDENSGIAAAYAQNGEATYKVWAESDSGEIFIIASSRSPSDGEIELTWNIPSIQPTGGYTICADQSMPADDWTMVAYASPFDEPANRNLEVQWSHLTEVCTSVDIEIYELSLTPTDLIILPGGQATIEGLVTNPVNGAKVNPESLEGYAYYYTDDLTNGLQMQTQNLFLPHQSEFNISFLIPSNVYQEGSSYYRQIGVLLWANASGGTQVKYASVMLHVGEMDVEIESPTAEQFVSKDVPFVLQAQAWIDAPGSVGKPADGLDLKVMLVQNSMPFTLLNAVRTDAQGMITAVLSLTESPFTGVCILRIEWMDPSTMGLFHTDQTLFVGDGSDQTGGQGQGIHIEAQLSGELGVPGSTLPVTVQAFDDGGEPLPLIWMHWRTEMTSYQDFWSTMEPTPWTAVRTDANGQTTVQVIIPHDFNRNEGILHLSLVGYNGSGVSDSLIILVPMEDQDVLVNPDRLYFHPGDEITYRLQAKGFSGEVTYFYTADDGTNGHIVADAENPVELTITIPLSWPRSSFDLDVSIASSQGLAETRHTLWIDASWDIDVSVTTPVVHAGEKVSVRYEVQVLVSDYQVDYPLRWTASVDGDLDDASTGLIDESSGILSFSVPDDAEPGDYVIYLVIEGDAHLLVYTVEEERHVMIDLAGSAAPTVSYLALFIGLICLVMLIRRRGPRGNDSDSFDPNEVETAPSETLAPSPNIPAPAPAGMNTLPPPPGSPMLGPPLDAVGKMDADGFEWTKHMGGMWYRRANSGEIWKSFDKA